jgi:hypothetical protein
LIGHHTVEVAEMPCRVRPPYCGRPRKLAVTEVSARIVTVHVAPETASHPLQPLKRRLGVAVRVTTVSMVYDSEQSVPQLMPAGLELTLPLPPRRPDLLIVSTKRFSPKAAVTALGSFIVTVHAVPEAVSHPLQPSKVDLLDGLAVRVTAVAVL